MITLPLILLLIILFTGFIWLLPYHNFEFLLHLVRELIPHSILLAPGNFIITLADMDGFSVTEIHITLTVVINTG